ncbi:Thymocyte nuclear protein 1 [Hypsizygus marmoreus]|uniref:Thymocyte nuclear protein 1 n=1 Tax=Hypsizygus marmoreus TaxID=39966 RepID=A0A369JCT0_HYPMA|nr:Thymocyte nuclear protein 1 [Hypsizygus marmoreus]
MTAAKYWLLKAEPDSRIVKGKDVKFSVDDFESVKTSPWEGVRNYEARNLMKEMHLGDKALFYHSNCKTPGVAGFAEVSKEAYPDYTAWDAAHPYYDAKTDEDNPKWYMVDLTFSSRATHFIPLALLRFLSECSDLPPEIEYIGDAGFKAIKSMDLVTRGRLSVQRVDEKAWDAITMLAEKGGWEDIDLKPKKGKSGGRSKQTVGKPKSANAKRDAQPKKKIKDEDSDGDHEEDEQEEDSEPEVAAKPTRGGRKRKAKADLDEDYRVSRRAARPRATK